MPPCSLAAVASLLALADALSSTKPHELAAHKADAHKHSVHHDEAATVLKEKHEESHKQKSGEKHASAEKRKSSKRKAEHDDEKKMDTEEKQAPTEAPAADAPAASDEEAAPAAANATAPQVRVEVFYETLCPYCEQFMLEELQPMWQDAEFGGLMDVAMYPAGNMMTLPVDDISQGYKFFHPEIRDQDLQHVFQCQHGPDECFGNMVQACAMKTAGSVTESLPFIFCMASRTAQQAESMEKISFDCLSEAGLEMEPILECVRGSDGNQHMFEIGSHGDALEPPKQWVPWVTLDGEVLAMEKGETLLAGLCKRLAPQSRPSACEQATAPQEKKPLLKRLLPWLNLASRPSGKNSTAPIGFCHPDAASNSSL